MVAMIQNANTITRQTPHRNPIFSAAYNEQMQKVLPFLLSAFFNSDREILVHHITVFLYHMCINMYTHSIHDLSDFWAFRYFTCCMYTCTLWKTHPSGRAQTLFVLRSESSEPLYAISMHNGLVITPIKVYVNRNNEEKFSFSLVEKDDQRINNGGNKDGGCRTTEEIVRFNSHYPLQFQFLAVVCQLIVDSFH